MYLLPDGRQLPAGPSVPEHPAFPENPSLAKLYIPTGFHVFCPQKRGIISTVDSPWPTIRYIARRVGVAMNERVSRLRRWTAVRDRLTSGYERRMLAGWIPHDHTGPTGTLRPQSSSYGHGLDRQCARYWPLAAGTSPLLAGVPLRGHLA